MIRFPLDTGAGSTEEAALVGAPFERRTMDAAGDALDEDFTPGRPFYYFASGAAVTVASPGRG